MTSARFRLGYGSSSSGPWTWGSYDAPIDASASQWIKAEFESTSGIDTAAFTISSADEVTHAAGVPSVTVDAPTKTAVFQLHATVGAVCIVRATANPNAAGSVSSELAVHVLTSSGRRLLALDETDQSSRTYYWLAKINDAIRYGATLPSATDNQFITYSGSAWASTSNLVLANDGKRTIKIEDQSSGNGVDLTISANSGGTGDDDGTVWLDDGSDNHGVGVGGVAHGASYATVHLRGAVKIASVTGTEVIETTYANELGFYNVTPVARQTVNWYNTDDSTLKSLMTALVALGLIDGSELVI